MKNLTFPLFLGISKYACHSTRNSLNKYEGFAVGARFVMMFFSEEKSCEGGTAILSILSSHFWLYCPHHYRGTKK